MPCKSKMGSRSGAHFFGQSDNATRRPYSILNTSAARRISCEVGTERSQLRMCRDRAERIRVRGPPKFKRVLNLAAEKGSSVWVTVLTLREIGSNLINGRSLMLSNFAKIGSSMIFPPLVHARKSALGAPLLLKEADLSYSHIMSSEAWKLN